MKTAGSYTSLTSGLLGIDKDSCRKQYGAAFCVVVIFKYGPVFGTVSVSFFSIGCNRFEVTLEKSNKNFSKKIQQVGSNGGCYIYI